MRAHAAAARTRPRWLGLGLESQLGSRSPDGPGAGKGGLRGGGSSGGSRPWRRVCLSPGRSLGAGDREGRRAGEEGCGSVEAAATGTRRHHLRRRGRRSRRLSGREVAAGTARRRPARPGRCPSPSEVPAAPSLLALPTPSPFSSLALERGGLLLTHGTPIPPGSGPPVPATCLPFLRAAFRPRPSAPPATPAQAFPSQSWLAPGDPPTPYRFPSLRLPGSPRLSSTNLAPFPSPVSLLYTYVSPRPPLYTWSVFFPS